MKRPFLWLCISATIIAFSFGTCYLGLAPDGAGAGEAGAAVMAVIAAAFAVWFYRKRNEPMT